MQSLLVLKFNRESFKRLIRKTSREQKVFVQQPYINMKFCKVIRLTKKTTQSFNFNSDFLCQPYCITKILLLIVYIWVGTGYLKLLASKIS